MPLILKGSSVVAELVEENTEGPYVGLFVDGLPPIDINHLRAPILQRSVLLNVFVKETTVGHRGRGRAGGRGGAKVAELESLRAAAVGDEHVLDLEIAVQKGGLEVVHAGDALGYIGKNGKDLGLCQAVLQARVHKVDETAAIAVLHQEEDLVAATAQFRGVGVNVGDDGAVALEALHRLDLGSHAAEGILVGHGNSLEDGEIGAGDRAGELDEIDVGKATFG